MGPGGEARTDASEETGGEESAVSTVQRIGYGLLGTVMLAMGLWIFPYQLERGDVLRALIGVGLSLLGGVVVVRATTGRRLESLEAMLDFLSGLGG